MRFQVILPTFNSAQWFEPALSSVAGCSDGEVFVIDDGSRTEERNAIAEICRRYKGVRFFAEPHRGLVGTLNIGLSRATAPYIARMDADDIAFPKRFEKQLSFLDSHPEIAVVGGQMIGIDSAGNLNGKSTRFPTAPFAIAHHLGKGKNPFMHPSVMMRRSALETIGGYRPAAEFAEDYDLWLRLVERYPLANLADPLIYYRRHDQQITRSTNWKQKFARDLSALSAHHRRAGRRDPIDAITGPFTWTDIPPDLHDDIQKLAKAYRALTTNKPSSPISSDEIAWILSSINSGLLGHSSKPRAKAAAKAAKLAWQNSKYALAIEAISKGLRLNPLAFAAALTN